VSFRCEQTESGFLRYIFAIFGPDGIVVVEAIAGTTLRDVRHLTEWRRRSALRQSETRYRGLCSTYRKRCSGFRRRPNNDGGVPSDHRFLQAKPGV